MKTVHERRRGYVLIEMMVTLGLVALAAGVAGRLVFSTLDAGRQSREYERDNAVVDHAAAALRQDVERAEPVPMNGGVTFGPAAWAAKGNTLVRTENGREQSFGPVPGMTKIETAGGVMRLRIGASTWAFRPIMSEGTR